MVKKYIKICIGLFLAGMILWIYSNYDFSIYINFNEMRALIDSFSPYGPLVFIGLCIAGIFLHLPEIVLLAM